MGSSKINISNVSIPSAHQEQIKPKRFTPVEGHKNEKFLAGPIPMSWLAVAAKADRTGLALKCAIVIWHLSMLQKARNVKLETKWFLKLNVSRTAKYRGLKSLENAGLIVCDTKRGRCTTVYLKQMEANEGPKC